MILNFHSHGCVEPARAVELGSLVAFACVGPGLEAS
jgi:hypothetical protein